MSAPGARPHVILVRVLLVVATILAVAAVFSVWANRQALNADNWANTSSEVLADPVVKQQLANYLVDELFSQTDVASQLRDALPPRLDPLAAPAAGGLRELSLRATTRLLGRPRVEKAWENANRITAQQFINIAKGNSGAITSQGNAVVLDLRVLVLDLVQRLGLSGRLAQQLPPSAGKITILKSDQVKTLQNGADALRGLAIVLPILSFLLFALCVFLARGRRRSTLLWVGIDLIVAGVIVLLARALLGRWVGNDLVGQNEVRPAFDATWSIATGMLRDVAQALIIGAVPIVLAAMLAGPSRAATAIRARIAIPLRNHPGAAYAILGAVLVLIIAWGPIPATREVIPALIMVVLAFAGLYAFREQVNQEFPAGPIVPAASGDGAGRPTPVP